MVDPMIRVGVDVGCKTHQVGIAGPDGTLLEEFSIPHTRGGFTEFFTRIEHHRRKLGLPVAVAMGGRGRPCPSPGPDDRGERLQTLQR